jgi:DNA-binding CsgD family transcriptional regulator
MPTKRQPISTPALVIKAAEARQSSGASGDAAIVRFCTPLRGDLTSADRKAAVMAALRSVGLVEGGFTPSPAPWTVTNDESGEVDDEATAKGQAKSLTSQRMEILGAFYEGLSYTETATATHRNVSTVKAHAENLYRLFGVSSKVECIVEAVRCGVLPPAPKRATAKAQG